MSLSSYRELRVWQFGMELAEGCYRLTRAFPRDEIFGITSQIRRAAVSVPANIAEGYGRKNRGEYVQFLYVAQGSLNELETHLLLCVRIELTTQEAIAPLILLCQDMAKMIGALIRSLQGG
jgi:four helix bundle protein